MIEYFISYSFDGGSGGFGHSSFSRKTPITCYDDLDSIRIGLMEKYPNLGHLVILYWRRFEEA